MISDAFKARLIHAVQVGFASFLTLIAAILMAGGHFNWTLNFWIPIIISAVSAGVKTVTDPSVPTSLGGTKS